MPGRKTAGVGPGGAQWQRTDRERSVMLDVTGFLGFVKEECKSIRGPSHLA